MFGCYGLKQKRKISQNWTRVNIHYFLIIQRKAKEKIENELYLSFIKEKEILAN